MSQNGTMKIKNAIAEYTGGNIYVYHGQFEDGTWFMSADCFDCIVEILNADPESDEDSLYIEWQTEHLIREVIGDEGRALLRDILVAACQAKENGSRMNAATWDLEERIRILDEGGDI